MSLKLIINPAAGKGKALRQLKHVLSSLDRHDIKVDISHTSKRGDATRLAMDAMGRHDVIAGLGGDGTLNEIASALKHSGIPLAYYPAGTGNDFMKALGPGITHDLVTDAIARGSTRTIDMAEVNDSDFINVLGIGFDALVAAQNARVRRLGGVAAYALALIKALPSYGPYPVKVTTEDDEIEADIVFLTIGNGPVCGGGFRLTPEAKVDDGMLDVTLVEHMPLPRLLSHIPKAFNGRVAEIKETALFRSKSIRITSPAPLPAHLDGDVLVPYANTYEIKINPSALRVISPLT